MATVRFTGSAVAEELQFADTAGEDTKDSQTWLDIDNPKTAKQVEVEASKSEGKPGDQPKQAEGGAEAPPEENPFKPKPLDLKPGISRDPTDTPAVAPTQDPTQDPEEEMPLTLLSMSKVTSRQEKLG